MKHLAVLAILLSMVFAVVRTAIADEAARGKIRVLITVGGHGFEEEPFYAMWKSFPNIAWTKADLPKQAGLLKPGLEKKYDVIVMYDMVPGIRPEEQEAFVALLKQGIGLVSWHHNLGAHPDWGEWPKIIGGKFFLKETIFEGKTYKPSLWAHDQEMKVHIAENHPITKGLSDFAILDEAYKGYWVSPEAKVLLTTDYAKSGKELAWVHKYGNSRVFHLMLGHDSKAWKNPTFQELLARGVRWAAGK